MDGFDGDRESQPSKVIVGYARSSGLVPSQFGGISGAAMAPPPAASSEMPRYKCHKEVWALKIAEIRQAPSDQDRSNAGGDWYLVPEDTHYAPIMVGHDAYYVKHNPKVGGYYVVYAPDGYASFSPANVFEDGYTRI